MRTLVNSLLSITAFSLIGIPSDAQQIIPAGPNNSCPGGTSWIGNGYCKAISSEHQYIPAGPSDSCPGGTSWVGNGYCRSY